MGTLEDSTSMDGNCAKAGHGWGQNEAYPCIDSNVTYGLAVSGLQVTGTVGQTSLSTGGLTYEVRRRSHRALYCMTLSMLPLPAALTESLLAKHLQPNVRGEQNATLIQPTGTCVQ
jgi:hypothetical protein